METTSTEVRIKVRIFADKPKKRWFGAFAFTKGILLPTVPSSYQITQTVDDEAEFVKGNKVHCVVDKTNELVAAWKV
jgi:hypothetical protein